MGSRVCADSSTHTKRHRLTSWWPLALMGVIARSAEKWSKAKQRKWGTAVGRHYESPQSEWYLPSSKACSNKTRLWSRPEKPIDADALRTRGTKRQEFLALRDLLCLLVSASVEMSPLQIQLLEFYWTWKRTKMRLTQISPKTTRRTIHTWLVTHGSMYCGAYTVLAWRAPNLKLGPGKTRSTRVTKVWMISRLTRWIKH